MDIQTHKSKINGQCQAKKKRTNRQTTVHETQHRVNKIKDRAIRTPCRCPGRVSSYCATEDHWSPAVLLMLIQTR